MTRYVTGCIGRIVIALVPKPIYRIYRYTGINRAEPALFMRTRATLQLHASLSCPHPFLICVRTYR
jgi:hypothetical protein